MKKQEAIAILQKNADALRARRIRHAALFGSLARGDARPDSDIDIIIELAPEASLDIFAYVELKNFVASLFPGPVDVVNKDASSVTFGRRPRQIRSMPSDFPITRLRDIRDNIELAFSFIGDLTLDQFLDDTRPFTR